MLRERITVTLEPDLVAAIDTLVDRQTLRNRSHAIEHLLKEGIGLHQLEQAFLFFEEGWTTNQLEAILQLCKPLSIQRFFICLPSSQTAQAQELAAQIQSQNYEAISVPADFGSGGAIILQKERLTNPFLIFWLGPTLAVPQSLLPAYVFHRQHHSLLTRLLAPIGQDGFQSAGIDIAQPELISHIPVGLTSLKETVFPALAKESKIRGYVTD